MDEDTLTVSRGGRPIMLSPTEYKLLRFLLINRERVLSKSQILDHVWPYDFGGSGDPFSVLVTPSHRIGG